MVELVGLDRFIGEVVQLFEADPEGVEGVGVEDLERVGRGIVVGHL